LEEVDVVIHAAAMPGLMLSWDNLELYSSCNILGTQRLVEGILKVNEKIKLTNISTSSVYGKIASGDETSILKPSSPYGVTKLAAEKIIEAYAENYKLEYTTLRYFSVFGPGQRADMAYSKFIHAIENELPLTVYGDGLQTRTNTYVSDCVEATIQISSQTYSNEIFNLSGEEKINVLEVIAI
jgi:nucleoside-diphosphate-sugar epimerase